MSSSAGTKKAITRKPLLNASLETPKSIERIEIKQIDFAPSQATGLHYHPCPVVGYIAKGSVRFQVEGQQERILHVGDAFFEPPNTKILSFDNASSTEPMTFIAHYLLGVGEDELIHMIE